MKHLHLLPILLLAGCSSTQPTTVAVAPPQTNAAPPVAPAPQPVSNPGPPDALGIAPAGGAGATSTDANNAAPGDSTATAPVDIPAGNPFQFQINSMPHSIESALAAVDRTTTASETLALLGYLGEARRDLESTRLGCGASNEQCRVAYSLSGDAISAVHEYAQTKADWLSGAVIDVAAQNGMANDARRARYLASLADDNLTGVAQRRSRNISNMTMNMVQNDARRFQRR